MLASMDDAGVDAAILVSPYSIYRFDPSYALDLAARYSDRFRVIAPVDPSRPDIDEFVAAWAVHPHTVGLRLMLITDADVERLVSGGADKFLRAATTYSQPICLVCLGGVKRIASIPRRHPNLKIVIDHLGLHQPFVPPPPADPFAQLPDLLALADCPNVSVKVSGVPTLSHQKFPYKDIWPALEQVFNSFGIERTMWGTDWTRALEFLSLEQAVRCFVESDVLSPTDLEQLMGGTLRNIFRWTPSGRSRGR